VHRGRGPRGYIRRPERIREDLCDRLTENPFVDASDIDVTVTGSEIVLTGTVDSDIALRQTQAIAQEVIGVTRVDNRLTIRGGETHPTVGDRVNAALAGLRAR
jgi:osmotically-inducible protein OsmY